FGGSGVLGVTSKPTFAGNQVGDGPWRGSGMGKDSVASASASKPDGQPTIPGGAVGGGGPAIHAIPASDWQRMPTGGKPPRNGASGFSEETKAGNALIGANPANPGRPAGVLPSTPAMTAGEPAFPLPSPDDRNAAIGHSSAVIKRGEEPGGAP